MHKQLLIVLLLAATIASCKKEHDTTVTDFSVTNITSFAPQRVKLSATGTSADSLQWYVNGRHVQSGNEVTTLLTRKGSYVVTLYAFRNGVKDSAIKNITVQNDPAMRGCYLFNKSWSDSSDYQNDISSGRGLLIYAPDRKNNPEGAMNVGNSGGSLDLKPNLMIDAGSQVSVSMWIKPVSLDKIALFGYWKNDEPSLYAIPSMYIDGSGTLRMKFADGSPAPQVEYDGLQANTWAHVVLTADGNVQKGYVNGQLIGTIQGNTVSAGNFNTTILGYMYVPAHAGWVGLPAATWSTYQFKGLFDDVRIYYKTLNQAEVTALYEE